MKREIAGMSKVWIAWPVSLVLLLGGCTVAPQSCCEQHTCENLRVLKTSIAAGYARCCQQEGPTRAECLNKVGNSTQSILALILQAQIACQSGDAELARDILRAIKEALRIIAGATAFQSIDKVDGQVENSVALMGKRDWISLSATLPRGDGSACKSETVAVVGTMTVNAEAAGTTTELLDAGAGIPTAALVIPAEAANALVSCEFAFPIDTPTTIRFGQTLTATVNGTLNLAPLPAQQGVTSALPTGVDLRIRCLGQTVTATLDQTSPFNRLEVDAEGVGYLGLALRLDSKSSGLSGSVYVGETFYVRFPVSVGANWSSIRFNLSEQMQGALYTPTSARTLAAADGESHVAIGGDPCADIDGNGIRDGADEVLRAISITSECGPTTGH